MNTTNKNKRLEDLLNNLWAGWISYFNFNLKKHRLTFKVKVIETKNEIYYYDVEISKISSYFFYQCDDIDDWKNMELTSIDYIPEQHDISITSRKDPSTLYGDLKITFNIFMEIWSSAIFIKANKIRINEEEFILES